VPSLLAVFAHPDDESLACGGLLAMCADAGVHVSLLCLTRGENGPGAGRGSLGDTRVAELDNAARILGVRDVTVLRHEDGMLPWISASLLEADIQAAIERFSPEVVLTFDEDGLYWHPDHVAVHEPTTAAVADMGASSPALWYVSLPSGAMRAVADAAGPDRAGPVLGVTDMDAFGSMAPQPSLVVDASSFAVRKLEALRCHRSQVDGSALDAMAASDAPRLLGTEHYRRASVGAAHDTFMDRFGAPAASVGRTS
jgi:LmbE family N-acetylglucosaminyl deacetylase